ncbi:MAG: bifunctional diaminohydroxyphosphoribosylaminopyrimidine deaminase/5-amino-6-(5-phosphoribosylamino)uracil reductase RibD [Thermodesulfovibrionales bacterium]
MSDEIFIRRTLSLAKRAQGRTSPNPLVGAVLVKNGRTIAEGYHKMAGTPHAEAVALERAGEKARGATLYVNLEPCCHTDKRTPPCTGRIIAAGIRRVVVAMTDPNPKVSGKGIAELQRAGITVVSGIEEDRARTLNEHYITYISTGRPFVILKTAMTLDGKIATPEGESQWITGEKARAEVQRLRGSVDAVMTAIGTVRLDDPRLTCRIRGRRSPLRIIIDPRLETGLDAQVLSCPPDTVVVTRESGPAGKKLQLRQRGIGLLEHEQDRVDLAWLMKTLGSRGITSVLIEGGASLNSSCLESGIVDRVMFFIAPKMIGGRDSVPVVGGESYRRLAEAHRVVGTKIRRLGEDFLIEGLIQK